MASFSLQSFCVGSPSKPIVPKFVRGRNFITWITSLSLDAPIVVAVWQNAISVHYSIRLSLYHRVLVFLAVWLGYTADRWIDAWRHRVNVSQRHSFHAIRRWTLLAVWVSILVFSIIVSFQKLTPIELRNGFLLALASLVVTGLIQLDNFGKYKTTLKSAFTALLVASSVLVFATPESLKLTLEALSVMTPLFFLNCILIHSWDRAIDAKQSPNDSNNANRFAISLATVFSIGFAFFLVKTNPLSWYVIAATLNLLAIHICFQSLHLETRRTLADIALLTPLVAFL